MNKYQMIEIVGEGSYGVVMKCRHRESGQLVAIKRFLETEEDHRVRKLAFREIRMLKKLHHENLVNMIEVFRRRKRFYLVFEYLDHTLLDELETVGGRGLDWQVSRGHIYQVLRGLSFCHARNIMHRDIKPENVLVSPNQVIKLCDFGFARLVNGPNESCTDYVATRWYRAPELLVGDPRYGKPVDIWAVGCLYAETVIGDPLFPGDSDVDQLHRITKVLGVLCTKHRAIMDRDKPGQTLRHANADELVEPPKSAVQSIRQLFPTWDIVSTDFLAQCLRMDPDFRPRCSVLLHHPLFTQNHFAETFLFELNNRIAIDAAINPLSIEGLASVPCPLSVLAPPLEPLEVPRWRILLSTDCSTNDKSVLDVIEQKKARVPSSLSRDGRPRGSPCHFNPISILPNTPHVRAVSYRPRGSVYPLSNAPSNATSNASSNAPFNAPSNATSNAATNGPSNTMSRGKR